MNATRAGDSMAVQMTVNGRHVERTVPVRLSLADFIREELSLTGTHLGCEQGACGACTVLLDGQPVRSCIVLAVQARARAVLTVEGLADGNALHPLQTAFLEHRAFQCGFCTPGMMMALRPLFEGSQKDPAQAVEEAIEGNVCRCTGYTSIVQAALEALGADVRGQGDHDTEP